MASRLCRCAVLALLAVACGPDADERPTAAQRAGPDGLLVLAVLSPERVVVADAGTGMTRSREVPGGTLCRGPVLAAGERETIGGSRGRRPVALSLPLDLTGPGRVLATAQAFAASATPGRVWLERWVWKRSGARVSLREVDASGRTRDATRASPPPRSSIEGAWQVVRGARLAGYRSIAWSPSGRWVYFTGSRHRVLAWPLGGERPRPLPIRTGGTAMSIATAAG